MHTAQRQEVLDNPFYTQEEREKHLSDLQKSQEGFMLLFDEEKYTARMGPASGRVLVCTFYDYQTKNKKSQPLYFFSPFFFF